MTVMSQTVGLEVTWSAEEVDGIERRGEESCRTVMELSDCDVLLGIAAKYYVTARE